MRKIAIEQLDALFAAISAAMPLYLPVDTKGGAKFDRWTPEKTLSDKLNTVRIHVRNAAFLPCILVSADNNGIFVYIEV